MRQHLNVQAMSILPTEPIKTFRAFSMRQDRIEPSSDVPAAGDNTNDIVGTAVDVDPIDRNSDLRASSCRI